MTTMPEPNRPVPDPTVLTTEQLLREIERVSALMNAKLDGIRDVVAEKFQSVYQQFDLIERGRVEQKSDTKAAVDAALTAQKEAVKEQTTASERAIAKSEVITKTQLDQQLTNFNTAIKGVTDPLTDLKDRVARIEAVKIGGDTQRTNTRETMGALYGLAGFVLALLVIGGMLAAGGGFK